MGVMFKSSWNLNSCRKLFCFSRKFQISNGEIVFPKKKLKIIFCGNFFISIFFNFFFLKLISHQVKYIYNEGGYKLLTSGLSYGILVFELFGVLHRIFFQNIQKCQKLEKTLAEIIFFYKDAP